MNTFEILSAPSPCEKFECSEFENCKESLLACQAFTYYVEKGRAIHPAMQKDEGGKFQMTGGTNPSRGEFERMWFAS